MNGLPAKYARMGFAKGWKAYRASKSKTTRSNKVVGMAKRKTTKARKSFKRGFKGGSIAKYAGAAIYGAGREYVSNAIAPLTNKLPLGNLADEAGMFITLWGAKKFLGRKLPLVNDVANAGMLIEAARVGAAFAAGQVNLGAVTSGSTANGQIVG